MPRVRTHPGRILAAELEARRMSANRLALAIRVPANRINAILRGGRAVTAETALRLGRYLGTGAAFWMNLQSAYELSVVERRKGGLIEDEVPAAGPTDAQAQMVAEEPAAYRATFDRN